MIWNLNENNKKDSSGSDPPTIPQYLWNLPTSCQVPHLTPGFLLATPGN